MTSTNLIAAVNELVDVIALEKPVDFEAINYEVVRSLSVTSAIEQYTSIMNNPELDEASRQTSLIAIIAYLLTENTVLWIENESNR